MFGLGIMELIMLAVIGMMALVVPIGIVLLVLFLVRQSSDRRDG